MAAALAMIARRPNRYTFASTRQNSASALGLLFVLFCGTVLWDLTFFEVNRAALTVSTLLLPLAILILFRPSNIESFVTWAFLAFLLPIPNLALFAGEPNIIEEFSPT